MNSPTTEARAELRHIPSGTIIDQFRIVRPIAEGGMGRIYLARDTNLGRKVALKLIRSRRAGMLRFLQEARTTAKFNHPHIVTVYAFGEYGGTPYLVLEYVGRDTLRDRMRKRAPLVSECLRLGEAIASAVAEAHRHGILHLDLKPSNVLITKDGHPKVSDFGLAKPIAIETIDDHDTSGGVLTKGERSDVGDLIGTPAYLAPEQWRRRASTEATDIWALGILLYELLAGRRPYQHLERDLRALARQVRNRKVLAPMLQVTNVHSDVVTLVSECLAKEPQDRPTAAQVAKRLSDLQRPSSLNEARGPLSSPFRGLRAFTERHASYFYGREHEIAEMIERLHDEPIIPIVGASGAGKSSFVHAGVIPRLIERDRWVILSFRPGAEPFKALATRLMGRLKEGRSPHQTSRAAPADPKLVQTLAKELFEHPEHASVLFEQISLTEKARVLLVVDQLEELFTLTPDKEVQHRFIQAISQIADDPADPFRVLLTVRDDYFSRLADAGQKVQQVLRHVMLLRVPERKALKDILSRPLKDVGFQFEDEQLIEEMVDAVGGQPASLPLLQFTAQMLWERRDVSKKILLRKTYESLGGVAGALAHHGDEVLQAFDANEQQLARKMCLRLVTSQRTRKLLPQTEVLEGLGPEARDVLGRLINARLVSVVRMQDDQHLQSAIELAHESLMVTWERLRDWIENDQGHIRFLAELKQAAELWQQHGKPDGEVWRGGALETALQRLENIEDGISPVAEAFLAAGRRVRDRRRISRAGVVALAFIVLTMALVVLGFQRQQALDNSAIAQKERAEAQREGAAAALVRGDMLEARAKLRTSLETDDSVLARALWWRLSQANLLWRQKVFDIVQAVALSPDGQTLAAVTNSAIHIYDLATQDPIVLPTSKDTVPILRFSPDGRVIAQPDEQDVILIGIRKRGVEHRLSGHPAKVTALDFAKDGTLASADRHGQLRLWGARDRVSRVLQTSGTPIRALAFDPSGRRLAAAAADGLTLWRLNDATSVQFKTPNSHIRDLDFGPKGQLLVSLSVKGEVHSWRVSEGKMRALIAEDPTFTAMALSDDGRVVVGGKNTGLKLYDTQTGQSLGRLSGPGRTISSAAMSKDGWFVASGAMDGTIQVYDATMMAPAPRLSGHRAGVVGLAFSRDGRTLATGSYDRTLRTWNVTTGAVERVIHDAQGPIFAVDFSLDNQSIAWGGDGLGIVDRRGERPGIRLRSTQGPTINNLQFMSESNTLVVAEGETVRTYAMPQAPVETLLTHEAPAFGLDTDPQGRVLSGGFDNTVRLWQPAQAPTVFQTRHRIRDVRLAPDGKTAISVGHNGAIERINLDTGKIRALAKSPGPVAWADLSPNGRRVAVSSPKGVAYLWTVSQPPIHQRLRGHRGRVVNIRFSPDGTRIATVSEDTTVRLYDAISGRPVWKAPALLVSTQEILTQDGWVHLETKQPQFRKTNWRTAIEDDAWRAVEVPEQSPLYILTYDGRLLQFDRKTDQPVVHARNLEGVDMHPSPSGCLVQTLRGATFYGLDPDDATPLASGNVVATGVGTNALLVSDEDGQIAIYDAEGWIQKRFTVQPPATALTASPGKIWIGHQNGTIEAYLRDDPTQRPQRIFDTPTSPVTRLLLGSPGTLLAGFQDGSVGLWDLETGGRLFFERLHGPIIHLVRANKKVYAASELGEWLRWDLSTFEMPHCELLADVWRAIQVVWQGGRAVVERPPQKHACRGQSTPRTR